MKGFVDFHLLLSSSMDRGDIEDLIARSAELGYSSVGIPLPIDVAGKDIEDIERICDDSDVDLVKRVDLRPRNPRELLRLLGIVRRRREVVAVRCGSKEVARQAAKDRRVDLLCFSSSDLRRRFFNSAVAELASKSSAGLEVDMAPLIVMDGFRRIRLISCLRREVALAKKFDVPVVLSSGAFDKYLLRSPQDYASMGYLFSLAHDAAVAAMSNTPRGIVEKNRRKLSPDYVAPGVYLVKRGMDCRDGW
jgi:ribonuclease P/MRP protein subunit RPP1